MKRIKPKQNLKNFLTVLCGLQDLSSQPGIEPRPQQWKPRILTPRPPRKTLKLKKFLNLNKTKFFKIKNYDLDILNLKKQNINKIKILIKIKLLRKLKWSKNKTKRQPLAQMLWPKGNKKSKQKKTKSKKPMNSVITEKSYLYNQVLRYPWCRMSLHRWSKGCLPVHLRNCLASYRFHTWELRKGRDPLTLDDNSLFRTCSVRRIPETSIKHTLRGSYGVGTQLSFWSPEGIQLL